MTQRELFEDVVLKPARMNPPTRAPLCVRRRLTASLTAQQAALVGVVALIVLVGAFAGGVERGRRLRQSTATRQPAPAVTHASQPAPSVAQQQAPSAATTTPPSHTPQRAFTIQLATYTNREAAHRELDKLTLKGHSAFLLEGDSRVALCVGSFDSHSAAKRQLTSYRQLYSDCFIRRQ